MINKKQYKFQNRLLDQQQYQLSSATVCGITQQKYKTQAK
jgi:hypothetical protein